MEGGGGTYRACRRLTDQGLVVVVTAVVVTAAGAAVAVLAAAVVAKLPPFVSGESGRVTRGLTVAVVD